MSEETLYTVNGPKSIYEMTWPEVADFLTRSDAVIIPIGQIAQHGKHMPLSSDPIQARELCRRTVVRLEAEGSALMLGPTIPFGHSPSHYEFPGTVELEPETLALVIKDIGRSLIRQGFRRLILFCCGGGNWSAVENAAYHLWRQDGALVFVLGYFETVPLAAKPFLQTLKRGEHDGHAGELETSVVLAVTPGLVDMRKAENIQSSLYREITALPFQGFNFNELNRATGIWNIKAISEQGSYGDATLASAETGNKILDAAAKVLADHIKRFVFQREQASR